MFHKLKNITATTSLILASFFITSAASADEKPVYLIVQLEITDQERFWNEYASNLMPLHEKHGVEILAASPAVEILEGEYNKNLTVILKYASADAQKAWYGDDDYQPLKTLRQTELTNTDNSVAIVVPSFTPQM